MIGWCLIEHWDYCHSHEGAWCITMIVCFAGVISLVFLTVAGIVHKIENEELEKQYLLEASRALVDNDFEAERCAFKKWHSCEKAKWRAQTIREIMK